MYDLLIIPDTNLALSAASNVIRCWNFNDIYTKIDNRLLKELTSKQIALFLNYNFIFSWHRYSKIFTIF